MPPALSRYFDLVRFFAAMLVVAFHAWPIFVPSHPLPWPGHDAVVVFFVMSGFVIAYVVDRKKPAPLAYALDRLARLWSVAIPALLIAAAARLCLGNIGIGLVAPAVEAPGRFAIDSLLNFFFLGETWGVHISPPLNSPFWSLNYEAWYYAIFAAFAFARPPWRWPLTALLMLAAGPKVLLLFPCWLAGVWLYRAAPRFSESRAALLFAASILAYLAFYRLDVGSVVRSWMQGQWPATMRPLALSNRFVGDTLLAAIVTANFAAAANLGRFAWLLFRMQRPIRACAALTLSIYLYHMPLIAIVYAGLGLHAWWALGLIALTIWALGTATEQHRGKLRAMLAW